MAEHYAGGHWLTMRRPRPTKHMLPGPGGSVAPMEGLSGPQGSGAWRLRRWAGPAALVVAVFAAVLLSDLPFTFKRVTSGSGLVVAGLAVALTFRNRFLHTIGRRRRAWLSLCISALCATLSNLLLLIFGYRANQLSPSDLALLLALTFGIIGITTFPLARRRGTDLTRMVLDGVVIGGSVLFILSVTLFPQILDTGTVAPAGLLAPISDVVISTVATLLMLRGAPSDRPVLGLTAAAFGCIAVSDFSYAVLISRTGAFTFGTIVDLGWIAGYTLLAIAVGNPGSTASPHGERPVESSPVLGTSLMFGLFMVAAVLSLVNMHRETLSTPSALLWFTVLLGVLARQIVLVVDNERLRRILEQRVIDRSRSLRQVAQQSDLLVNSVDDGIYGVDHQGLVTFVNPAAARVLGYAPHELIGQDAHEMFHADAPDGSPYPIAECYVTEAILHRIVTNAEEDRYLRADGLPVPVEVTASPLIVDDESIGAVVVFRDMTERQEVDRMKSEFVSMVSHELRTPLTAIRGSLGLIAGGALGSVPAAASRMVDIALLSCERLTRLINEILDIERVESGVMSLDLDAHPALSLIEAAVGQVQVIAEEAGVPVVIEQADGVVYADADRVVQTLLNLVGNAIKFSEPGAPVRVSAERRGTFVQFCVADDGRGIPEDKLDSIFARFQQVDSSDAREKGGSGLGLAISRSIVERLGGRIWATNNPEHGASFRFTLPAPVDPEPFERVTTEVDLDAQPLAPNAGHRYQPEVR